MPPLDILLQDIAIFLLGAGQMKCFPSPGTLLPQDRKSPKCIATMKRNGMVKNVQDALHVVSLDDRHLAESSVAVKRFAAIMVLWKIEFGKLR